MTKIEQKLMGRVDRAIYADGKLPYGFIIGTDGGRYFFRECDCVYNSMPMRHDLVTFWVVPENDRDKNDRAIGVEVQRDHPA